MATSGPLNAAQKTKLKAAAANYDFLRFSTADLNGILRGKFVPRASVDKFVDKGITAFLGLVSLGHLGQVANIKEYKEYNYGNAILTAAHDDVINTPWADTSGENKIGLIFCETTYDDYRPQGACPRYILRRQVEQLEELNLQLLGGYEFEFHLRNASTKTPVFNGPDIYVDSEMFPQMATLSRFYRSLSAAGQEIEQIHAEYSTGQFELVTSPRFGLDMADKAILIRECVKEHARVSGLEATFMTKLDKTYGTTGMHLSHSILDKQGNNILGDDSSADKISARGRHWLGGLIKHAGALSAICSPAVNCYRRWNCPFCPGKANWGPDDRHASFRVKNSTKDVIFENRLVSGAANPYLSLAATIAAGLDGLKNKIELPKPNEESATPLPATLEDALKALEGDKVMVEALGSEFVTWYCQLKRDADLTFLKDVDIKNPESSFEKEQEHYLKFT